MQASEQIQRLAHHDGQLLTARDLQDDVGYDARMRGLHVRALHGVWGIALGYELLPTGDPRFLQVTQGMAYDCAGREILLAETLQVELAPPPRGSTATAWWFDFLVRYNPTLTGSDSSVVHGCPEIGPRITPERPAWRWSYAGDAPNAFIKAPGFADDVRLGEEIPLARVRITDTGKCTDVDLTVRRVARSLSRLHIATGQVRAGSISIDGSPLQWTAWIDTASAGFNTANPFYFVSLSEDPLLGATSGFADLASSLTDKQKSQLLGPFINIGAPTNAGFSLDICTATPSETAFKALPKEFRRKAMCNLPISVNWFGFEPNGGCRPPLTSLRFLISSYSKIGGLHL